MAFVIATTGEDGVLVTQNAENLSGAISSTQTTIVFNTDLFSAGDIIILDQERVLVLTDAGTGSYTVTRGYESTTKASHVSGTVGYLKGGKEVLSETFDGSTFLRLVRMSAHEKGVTFAVSIGGVIKYRSTCSVYSELERTFPVMKTPAASTVVKVLAWSAPISFGGLAQVNVDAVMQS